MPRVGDCKKGKIYAIRSHQTDQIYIGSTTQTLAQRLGSHRKNYKCYKIGKYHYTSSFEIIQHEDNYIELIEDFSCENIDNLRKREGEIIRQTDKCINKIINGRTRKEYIEDNKEYLAQKKKEWDEKNKMHVSQKSKEYRDLNRNHLIQKSREYYEKVSKKKITCECGIIVSVGYSSNHLKSKSHFNNMLGLATFGL